MEIIFLGTSSGVPTKHRNVSAAVIKHRNHKSWCLVDCGEGTQHQLLHTKLSMKHLAAIMITHVHGDHCFGLPGLLASAAMSGRTEPLTLVAPLALKGWIEATQQMSETFLTFDLNFIDVDGLTGGVEVEGLHISAHPLSHRVPSFAYRFTESQIEQALDVKKLQQAGIQPGPIWGQLQQGESVTTEEGQVLQPANFLLAARKPRSVVVGGDNDSPDLLKEVMAGVDVLVHESTYTDTVALQVGPGPQHSSAKKVAEFAAAIELNNLILTHFSARYVYGQGSSNISEIEKEAQQYFKGQLFLANDFDRYHLNKEGELQRVDSRDMTEGA